MRLFKAFSPTASGILWFQPLEILRRLQALNNDVRPCQVFSEETLDKEMLGNRSRRVRRPRKVCTFERVVIVAWCWLSFSEGAFLILFPIHPVPLSVFLYIRGASNKCMFGYRFAPPQDLEAAHQACLFTSLVFLELAEDGLHAQSALLFLPHFFEGNLTSVHSAYLILNSLRFADDVEGKPALEVPGLEIVLGDYRPPLTSLTP